MIKNLDKINKVKRKNILNGLQFIEENDISGVIKRVSVFGSSVREDCYKTSDIDLVFYTNRDIRDPELILLYGKVPIAMDDICDIFIGYNLTGRFKEVVNKTEVYVYENSKH